MQVVASPVCMQTTQPLMTMLVLPLMAMPMVIAVMMPNSVVIKVVAVSPLPCSRC